MKGLCVGIFILLMSMNSYTQGTAGSSGDFEPRYIIDMPAAGLIGHNSYSIDVDFFQSGGVLSGFTYGLLNRINIGISYGGINLIGSTKPKWNKYPGMNIKIRPIEEGEFFPAIALGFDSQGKENYIDSLDRYIIKSPGFFIVLSKNFLVSGFLTLHGGINYSLERADGDRDINTYTGIEKSLTSFLSILGEYNIAINDSDPNALGKGRGYLNLGLRASLGNGFTIGFNLKDVIKNQNDMSIGNRTINIEYVGFF
jgi:hypothetical protein